MLPMTRHRATHTGLGTPSPLDHWINALLRSFAMLVSHVARLCSMRLIRHAPECHSAAMHEALPRTESGKLKEPSQAAASSQPPEGLMLRTIATAIVDSKHEAGL